MTRVMSPSNHEGVVMWQVDGREVIYRRDGATYINVGWIAERNGRWLNSHGQSFCNDREALKSVVNG